MAAKKTAPTPTPPAAAPNNPATALFAAAAQTATRVGGDTAAHAAQAQIPASKPVRLEVKLDGRTRYAQKIYNPKFDTNEETGKVTITADLNPTMVDPPPMRPPTQFHTQQDPRDGEEVIMRVHSGRRDLPPAEES